MSIYGDKNPVLLLKCQGAETASDAAVAIVEGMMKSVIYDFGDIIADDVSGGWMDQSYATQAHEVLEEMNPNGVPEDVVEATSIEAEMLMSDLMAQNHHVLQTMSDGWVIDEVTVLRRLPNLWVVQVSGSRFPF